METGFPPEDAQGNMVRMRRDSLKPTPLLASRAHSHHLGHLEAQFLVRGCQHGQGPCGCILQLVIILPAEQYHQLQPVIPIRQKPLLYLWEEGPWLRTNALTCPAWGGKDAPEATFPGPGSLGAFL